MEAFGQEERPCEVLKIWICSLASCATFCRARRKGPDMFEGWEKKGVGFSRLRRGLFSV
jgi:hypothetical protein